MFFFSIVSNDQISLNINALENICCFSACTMFESTIKHLVFTITLTVDVNYYTVQQVKYKYIAVTFHFLKSAICLMLARFFATIRVGYMYNY